jgi:hypothetical protein
MMPQRPSTLIRRLRRRSRTQAVEPQQETRHARATALGQEEERPDALAEDSIETEPPWAEMARDDAPLEAFGSLEMPSQELAAPEADLDAPVLLYLQ